MIRKHLIDRGPRGLAMCNKIGLNFLLGTQSRANLWPSPGEVLYLPPLRHKRRLHDGRGHKPPYNLCSFEQSFEQRPNLSREDRSLILFGSCRPRSEMRGPEKGHRNRAVWDMLPYKCSLTNHLALNPITVPQVMYESISSTDCSPYRYSPPAPYEHLNHRLVLTRQIPPPRRLSDGRAAEFRAR